MLLSNYHIIITLYCYVICIVMFYYYIIMLHHYINIAPVIPMVVSFADTGGPHAPIQRGDERAEATIANMSKDESWQWPEAPEALAQFPVNVYVYGKVSSWGR